MTDRFTGLRFAPELLEQRVLLSFTLSLDYTYDSSGFFTAARRSVLAAAASSLTARLADSFSAITPGGSGSWTVNFTNPSSAAAVAINNPTIPANTVKVYVGARTQPTGQLGEGGPAGWSGSGTQAWFDTINKRGQTTAAGSAPEYTPYVGFISFSSNANWFSGSTISGIGSSQSDFYSAAVHELGHVLGIGTTASWLG
ncbi:MAG: Calx-beta protein, partial [Phycisphaerales bacterium]|nr:Calx-beta protein [Phycisphaerales bacterium]